MKSWKVAQYLKFKKVLFDKLRAILEVDFWPIQILPLQICFRFANIEIDQKLNLYILEGPKYMKIKIRHLKLEKNWRKIGILTILIINPQIRVFNVTAF